MVHVCVRQKPLERPHCVQPTSASDPEETEEQQAADDGAQSLRGDDAPTPEPHLFLDVDPGGFYHDGRFPTLSAVLDHYDSVFNLGLNAQEKSDLVEYLKSLPSED